MLKQWVLIILLMTNSCMNKMSKYSFQKEIMYTTFDIIVYTNSPKKQINDKIENIWQQLHELDNELSSVGTGFVGKLNEQGFITRNANPKIFAIVSNFIIHAKEINANSGGAFDLTVYPLVRLWGFYLQDGTPKIPSQQKIDDALKSVGMEKIIFTHDGIQLLNHAQIDLGAIAKGYAVDVAISLLTNDLHMIGGIVNAGGNLRVFGQKPNGSPWKVGIRNPNGGTITEIVTLYDGEAIATSGDYERFFVVDGHYYHHIFNPQTGKPVTHHLASVSVIYTNSAEMSDILATTLLVLGTKKATQFIKQHHKNLLPWLFIQRNGTNLITTENTLWTKRKKY